MRLLLRLRLLSDSTFGRGDGVAGLLDAEVEHDPATGLPFVRGRTLKGLLVEECAGILFALERQGAPARVRLAEAALFLFGRPGSTLADDALMRVGPAQFPADLTQALRADIRRKELAAADVLESLTAIRRRTAVDAASGAPAEGSLRSQRVLLRDTVLTSSLEFVRDPSQDALGFLAACVRALRRGGVGRNRGLGRLAATLHDAGGVDVTAAHFGHFRQAVLGGAA